MKNSIRTLLLMGVSTFQLAAQTQTDLYTHNQTIAGASSSGFVEAVGNGHIIRNPAAGGYGALRLMNDQNHIFRMLEIDYSGSGYGGSLLTGGPTGESGSIATTGNYPLAFGTSNTFRMLISGSGNVGIGTTTPNVKLEVTGPYGIPSDHGGMFKIIGGTGNNTQLQFGVSANLGYTWMQGTAIGNTNGINMALNPLGGNVGIGTTTPGSFKLAVNGKIWAQEVQVAINNPGPDYVFEPNYKLLSLEEIKSYIEKNKHLPEVPSAKEMETNGVNVSEMNMLLLKKIEELTLHLIEKEKQYQEIKNINSNLSQRLESLEKIINK